jgi:uncharacterized protein YjbI with pentapeptide repeats
MPCCKASIHDDWCRDVPISYKDEAGKEYCLFHAPQGQKGVPPDEFNKYVFRRINARSTGEPCDFSGTIFEGDISFRDINGANALPPISFEQATFNGETDFEGATFTGNAHFYKAIFTRWVNFSETTFTMGADFPVATFARGAKFSEAIFAGSANFEVAIFTRWANFSETTFTGNADFYRATFTQWADFSEATFTRGAKFHKATFSEYTSFLRTTFTGNADFEEARFKDRARFRDVAFGINTNFENLIVDENISFERTDLKTVSFLGTNLDKIEFVYCAWQKAFGRDILYNEAAIFGLVTGFGGVLRAYSRLIPESVKTSPLAVLKRLIREFKEHKENIIKTKILYQQLKTKYLNKNDLVQASNWHYGEQEMERKSGLFKRWFPLSLNNLYWLSSGYGERSVRAGVILGLLIIACAVWLGFTGIAGPEGTTPYVARTLTGLWQMKGKLFASVLQYVTFELRPRYTPLNDFVKVIIKVLIPLQAALFALAIRNRFRRQ